MEEIGKISADILSCLSGGPSSPEAVMEQLKSKCASEFGSCHAVDSACEVSVATIIEQILTGALDDKVALEKIGKIHMPLKTCIERPDGDGPPACSSVEECDMSCGEMPCACCNEGRSHCDSNADAEGCKSACRTCHGHYGPGGDGAELLEPELAWGCRTCNCKDLGDRDETCTAPAADNGCATDISGGGWTLVRHAPGGADVAVKFYKATDRLA